MRDLAAQRVVMVLQPGNIPVIEKAIASTDEDVTAALHTALLRGWVEVLHDAVPRAQIPADGTLPKRWEHTTPIYRVTDAAGMRSTAPRDGSLRHLSYRSRHLWLRSSHS